MLDHAHRMPCTVASATAFPTAAATFAPNSFATAEVPTTFIKVATCDSGNPAATAADGTSFTIQVLVVLVRMVV